MKRACETKLEMFVVSIVSSLFIICAGCSSGGATAGQAVTPISIPKASRSVVTEADTIAAAAAATTPRFGLGAAGLGVVRRFRLAMWILEEAATPRTAPLTYQTLGEMLQKIGLNPEDNKDCYVMKVKATTEDQDSWTFPIRSFAVSGSGDSSLDHLPTCTQIDQKRSAAELANAVRSSRPRIITLPGRHFSFSIRKHFLVLQQPLPNLGGYAWILGSESKKYFSAA